jgi:hypothetical protein
MRRNDVFQGPDETSLSAELADFHIGMTRTFAIGPISSKLPLFLYALDLIY